MSFSFTPTQEGSPQDPNATKAYSPPITEAFALASRLNIQKGAGFIQTVLFFVFGAFSIVTIVLFVYSYLLNTRIEAKKVKIATYEKELGALPVLEMSALSNRIKAISQLVKEHSSVRVALDILEHSVENPVVYKSFSMMFSESLKMYELQLNGKAPSYRAVAQQVDTFKRKPYTTYIPTLSLGSLTLNLTGEVDFSIKMPVKVTGILPESLILNTEETKVISSQTGTGTSTVIAPNP